ncbi:unnamed protein product [Sphenostylis stenocarpa]|uniref:Prolamin-like domain-containing protein n=1 Tax=Sphenostylis stenocarpa TaxID=92480 RepID=A0AA86SVZ9_9FABA|nr:unnamed protein product [Sphenostylis stenocarpa]
MLICFMIGFSSSFNVGLSNVVPAPSNAAGPMSSCKKYLTNCGSNLDRICGEEIFLAVFFGNTTVRDGCCDELMGDVGKVCHDDMTRCVLTLPKFRNSKVEMLKRGQKVWNDCVFSAYSGIQPVPAEC